MNAVIHRIKRGLQRRFFKTEFDLAYERWVQDRGDETLRLDYPLTSDSIVFDLGGFEGEWAAAIYNKYRSHVLVFEPVESFHNAIADRFSDVEKVQPYMFGLSAVSAVQKIFVAGDGSSQFTGDGETVSLRLVNFDEFMKSVQIHKIDLIKINIEGGEYDLLDYLVRSEWIKKINNLQIQFHNFVSNARGRREQIRNALAATHEITYDYSFVWENWKLR